MFPWYVILFIFELFELPHRLTGFLKFIQLTFIYLPIAPLKFGPKYKLPPENKLTRYEPFIWPIWTYEIEAPSSRTNEKLWISDPKSFTMPQWSFLCLVIHNPERSPKPSSYQNCKILSFHFSFQTPRSP